MKIGFIGLGNMGLGMASNLAAAGHDVRALDISKDAVAKAVDAGCAAAENATWGSIFIQVATLGYGSILGQFAAVALFLDFNQEQELEADVIGLERLEANGYDAQDSINLWKNLNLEMAASTNKRVRKRSGQNAAIFATHPPTLERISALEEQLRLAKHRHFGKKSEKETEYPKYRLATAS